MGRNDLAIYTPGTNHLYESGAQRARTGGAELQTKLLAEGLVERGKRVAHIVFDLHSAPPELPAGLTLIERHDLRGRPGRRQKPLEVLEVWRALGRADAAIYLFRGSSIQLVVGAAFCRVRRRRLLFAAANDLDFVFDRDDRDATFRRLYRRALTRAALVVVQTEAQRELALAAGLRPQGVKLIRSFAEAADSGAAAPEAFLWAGRLVDYKRPLEYVRLARALPGIEFVMVAAATNETPPGVAEAVEAAGRELPNLTVLGAVAREEVLGLIEGAIAIVSTSTFEGMPNVFLEGWARGVPALSLSFDPDGRIERFGLGLACGGSWERFSRAADELAADPELRAGFAEAGSRYIAENHSLELVGGRWDALVSELLGD